MSKLISLLFLGGIVVLNIEAAKKRPRQHRQAPKAVPRPPSLYARIQSHFDSPISFN